MPPEMRPLFCSVCVLSHQSDISKCRFQVGCSSGLYVTFLGIGIWVTFQKWPQRGGYRTPGHPGSTSDLRFGLRSVLVRFDAGFTFRFRWVRVRFSWDPYRISTDFRIRTGFRTQKVE